MLLAKLPRVQPWRQAFEGPAGHAPGFRAVALPAGAGDRVW